MASGYVSRKHLATRQGTACALPEVKMENITSIPQRVTCTPCRNSPHYVDAIARHVVSQRNRPGPRPRKATR